MYLLGWRKSFTKASCWQEVGITSVRNYWAEAWCAPISALKPAIILSVVVQIQIRSHHRRLILYALCQFQSTSIILSANKWIKEIHMFIKWKRLAGWCDWWMEFQADTHKSLRPHDQQSPSHLSTFHFNAAINWLLFVLTL